LREIGQRLRLPGITPEEGEDLHRGQKWTAAIRQLRNEAGRGGRRGRSQTILDAKGHDSNRSLWTATRSIRVGAGHFDLLAPRIGLGAPILEEDGHTGA
jgi:hypothetical protein